MKEETILSNEYAEFLTVTCLEWKHVLKDNLVVVGQNILLLLVSPSCRWSKYFVIVGLPTNNIVVAERQDISGLEAEFNEH